MLLFAIVNFCSKDFVRRATMSGLSISILHILYSHMPLGKVWIYWLLFVCVCVCTCVCVWLHISLLRIKLVVSNFARRFIGIQGRESHFLGNFAPPEVQNRTNHSIAHALANSSSTLIARRIGICEYKVVPEDGRTCSDFDYRILLKLVQIILHLMVTCRSVVNLLKDMSQRHCPTTICGNVFEVLTWRVRHTFIQTTDGK